MIARSIRNRIQIWHTVLLSLIMGGLLTAFYSHEKEIRLREFDASLMAPITSLIPLFIEQPRRPRSGRPSPPDRSGRSSPPDRSERPPPLGREGSADASSRPYRPGVAHIEDIDSTRDRAMQSLMQKGFYILSMGADGSILYSSENAPSNTPYPSDPDASGQRTSFIREQNGNRECIHFGPTGNAVILGSSAQPIEDSLQGLRWQLWGLGLAVVITGHFVGWLLVGRSLRPIRSVTLAAEQIANGNLSERISEDDTQSELGQMVEVLNDTFEKLESSFDQQVRFTADASHELRTPISVILAKCQFALMRDREPEKYRSALKTCEASAQHIRGLVESLLELAKVDSGEFKILKKPGDLANVAQSCADLLSTLAEEKRIDVELALGTASVEFDYDRMHQVGINLISNAIKYTESEGMVQVFTGSEGGEVVLKVSDTGAGVRPEDIPHLFDRFYRTNKERSDERKSTGLGLAITKAIVEAHGASIEVTSEFGRGTCFTVRFPVASETQLPELEVG